VTGNVTTSLGSPAAALRRASSAWIDDGVRA
jgi:hypothetical protein